MDKLSEAYAYLDSLLPTSTRKRSLSALISMKQNGYEYLSQYLIDLYAQWESASIIGKYYLGVDSSTVLNWLHKIGNPIHSVGGNFTQRDDLVFFGKQCPICENTLRYKSRGNRCVSCMRRLNRQLSINRKLKRKEKKNDSCSKET